jgi:hypothetical protein
VGGRWRAREDPLLASSLRKLQEVNIMATVTSRAVIEEMIANDGTFPGDPKAFAIYEFRSSMTGEVAWAVFYDPEHIDIADSPYVADYAVLWGRDVGVVEAVGVLADEPMSSSIA